MLPEEKTAIMREYATHEGDTGSPEVQIAVLTKRINDLTELMRRPALVRYRRRPAVLAVKRIPAQSRGCWFYC